MSRGGKRRRLGALPAALAIQWRAAPVASAVSVAFAIATSSAGTLAAWLAKLLMDELARGAEADGDRALTLAVAGTLVGSSATALWHASHYADVVVRSRITSEVERALFERVVAFDQLRPFEDPAFHARLRLAAEAARAAPHHVAALLQAGLRAAVTVGSLLGIVLVVWPTMALLLALLVLVGLSAQLYRVRYEVRLIRALVHGQIWQESYRALLLDPRAAKELQLFGTGPVVYRRMMKKLEQSLSGDRAREWTAALAQGALGMLAAAVAALGALVVVRRELAGELGLGDVALFTAAVAGIHGNLAGLVTQIGETGPKLVQFRAYLDLVAAPALPITGRRGVPPLSRAIELRDVWFRYTPDGPWVLRGASLTIAAGRATGLVGVNGAGKSTLVKLLARFYDVERGAICWDGIDLRELDPIALRRRLAATFQDFVTYDLSAADNIGLGDASALDDLPRIREAARLAGIDGVLAGLPDGYATQLSRIVADDERSTRGALSGGQWQRVALARALLRRDADLMVLDEPTSGLDANAEGEIHTLLHSHAAGRTRLLISHRLSALRMADAIAVLSDGAISELGTHDELMRSGQLYARMFTLQAAGYQDARVQEANLG